MLTVKDVIGDRYRYSTYDSDTYYAYDDWAEEIEFQFEGYGGGNCIFISAPTGSGKTSFILNTWMNYMAAKQMKVLYLVNRSILKEQLKEKIADEYAGISHYIDIKLYQDIERELKTVEKEQGQKEKKFEEGFEQKTEEKFEKKLKGIKQKYSQYACVVCDECHYFLADSNYNTNTALSFRWIQDCFSDKIRIFMSATIENVELYIKAYDEARINADEGKKYYLPNIKSVEKDIILQNLNNNSRQRGITRFCKYLEYKIDRNYDYIDVNLIHIKDKESKENRENEIVNLVKIKIKKKNGLYLLITVNLERN